MRSLLPIILFAALSQATAQQVSWLNSSPMDYSLNPGLPDQALASAPGRLVAMRTVYTSLIFGQEVYGDVALDALDPVSGSLLLSCLLLDSVSVDAAAVDPVNGIAYFSGRFVGDVLEACDGSQLQSIGGFLTENHFLLAWDLVTGFPIWMRNLSVAHPDAVGVPSLAMDPDGNLWYAVEEWGIAKVVRVDADGADMETRVINNVRLIGTLSFDPWGGLYVSGSCGNGAFTFGGQTFIDEGTSGYSMFVLRYRPDGSAGFAEFAEDVTFHNPTVAATSDGHAYLAGDLLLQGTQWGSISFGGPNWLYDVFLTKLDSTGQFLWGRESAPGSGVITGDMHRAKGPCVTVDVNDRPYLMGTLRGQVDWGNGVVSDGLTLGAQTITIVSFSPDGTPQWEATSTPTGFCQAQTLTAMAEEDALHFAAHITSQLTFNPHTTNVGGMQAAMVGRIGGLSTGVEPATAPQMLSTWPNPATDLLFIEWAGGGAIPGELINGVGQRVRSFRLVAGRNAVDVGGLAEGLYLVRLADGRAARVVVE
ncbi:MAG: hypothetical protein IPM46_02420 [Flavobacteriales bacterium]|nr:hypothetical protein [Flavobacteriales bacterium]